LRGNPLLVQNGHSSAFWPEVVDEKKSGST
jgi:hypothetical protein